MPCLRHDGVLLAGMKLDLVPDGVGVFAMGWRCAFGVCGGFTFHIEIDGSGTTAECLLLALEIEGWDGWMLVLWTGLAGEQHKFFGAVMLIVDVGDDDEASGF